MTAPSPAEARAVWVQELRSGRHQQGTGQLHRKTPDGDRLCCLGVACVVAVERGWVDLDVLMGARDDVLYDEHVVVLPENVRRVYGLRTDSGYFRGSSLAKRNDGGASFSVIADVIESEPDGLVVT